MMTLQLCLLSLGWGFLISTWIHEESSLALSIVCFVIAIILGIINLAT